MGRITTIGQDIQKIKKKYLSSKYNSKNKTKILMKYNIIENLVTLFIFHKTLTCTG